VCLRLLFPLPLPRRFPARYLSSIRTHTLALPLPARPTALSLLLLPRRFAARYLSSIRYLRDCNAAVDKCIRAAPTFVCAAFEKMMLAEFGKTQQEVGKRGKLVLELLRGGRGEGRFGFVEGGGVLSRVW